MSRIEKALEKAAELRGQQAPAPSGGKIEGALERVAKKREEPAPSSPKKKDAPAGEIKALVIDHPLMVTYKDPQSPIAEEFRKLKSTIVHQVREKSLNRALMVTSSLSGEGKSITAINLAITLAQEYDHTVLLVDADLRKPSVHKYLHLGSPPGLADCLCDDGDVSKYLVRTDIGRLSILPAGRQVDNPSELLASDRMKRLVLEIKNRYPDRFVIFDTPPVLPVAEARTLCEYVDAVLFVVREGAVSRTHVTDALGAIKRQKVLGLVYNSIHSESLRGRYHYYYHGY